jgi:hypothetical protein
MTPLTVAATLLGMSELALAGDGTVDATPRSRATTARVNFF